MVDEIRENVARIEKTVLETPGPGQGSGGGTGVASQEPPLLNTTALRQCAACGVSGGLFLL